MKAIVTVRDKSKDIGGENGVAGGGGGGVFINENGAAS